MTAHIRRIHIRDQGITSDAAFEALLEQIRGEIDLDCDRVLTAEPDYLVMGMSAETFWGGVEGNIRFCDIAQKDAEGRSLSVSSMAARNR